MATVNWSLQHKRDTAANWTSNNPTLLAGQLGIETDGLTTTPKFKIGDGVTAWATLPYFYGGALSAQNLNNVLTVGNTTAGKNIVLTDDDIIQVGSTPNRKIGFNTSTIAGGLELVNLNSNDHIILQDAGGIHIDTTYVQLPQVTASRILATDANNKITGAYTTTGSGSVLALSTSPTFTTDITTPLIIGGSAVGSNITYKSTSGTGTTTAAAHTFTGGTNGGTTIATLYNDGQYLIGTTTRNPTSLGILRIGQGTSFADFGERSSGLFGIWANQTATNSTSNYTIVGSSTDTFVNAPTSLNLNTGGNVRLLLTASVATFTPALVNTGAVTNFTFTKPNNTNQTASTAINGVLWTLGSRQWATGAITTQKEFELTSPTYSFVGASTITSAYSLYVNAPTAGTNATITNNYAAGFSGSVQLINGRLVENQGADVASANNLVLGTDGNCFEITGTTQVNLMSNIGWQNGSLVTLLFTSTPTVKHNQATSTTNITIQLAGAVDFVATAGDTLTLRLCEIGGTQAWREVSRAVI